MQLKKIKLRTEYKYDFHLFGIVSKSKEYSLTWSINRASGLELKKMDDLEIDIKNEQTLLVSNYFYETEAARCFLINNRLVLDNSEEKNLLAPSLRDFDYVFKLESAENSDQVDQLFAGIRKAENVMSVVRLDVNKVKEKEYFLF